MDLRVADLATSTFALGIHSNSNQLRSQGINRLLEAVMRSQAASSVNLAESLVSLRGLLDNWCQPVIESLHQEHRRFVLNLRNVLSLHANSLMSTGSWNDASIVFEAT